MREPKILIAEDNEIFREKLAEYLSKRIKAVFQVTGNGLEATQWIEKDSFDVVLTDYQMSGADGLKILSQAKKRDPKTIVFVISGTVSPKFTDTILAMGGYFVAKPVPLELLFKRITERLDEKGGLEYKL